MAEKNKSAGAIKWEIGCSGFHYKHWKNIFYPEGMPQKQWFSHYCRYFNTLELNVTFYRFPRYPVLHNWYEISSPLFQFSVKAPKAITHYKKFLGTADMLSDFYGTCAEALEEKLACILFQMPPNYHFTQERLDRIIDSLNKTFRNVVEFRHSSWWNESVYAQLAKHNISFCGMSHPSLPDPLIATTDLLYYRFHGNEQLYGSEYTEAQLRQKARETPARTSQAFIYFNNDINGYAINNAQQFQEITKQN